MDERGISFQIQQSLLSLPAQERRVGEYILGHRHDVPDYSITRLAEASGTSSTTISRFCQRMAVGGYGQLKIALAKEWGLAQNLVYVEIEPGDTLASVAQKTLGANIRALYDLQKALDLEVVQQIAEALWLAGRVDIYATGGAGIAARELHFKCMQLGLNANAFLDSQMQVMSASALNPGDAGIAISHSGRQGHVAEALRLAASQGAKTIALTSYPDTPVAKAAEIVLYTTSLAGIVTYDSPRVRTVQLAVVDVVYDVMLMQGNPPVRDNMDRVARAMSKYTAGLDPSV